MAVMAFRPCLDGFPGAHEAAGVSWAVRVGFLEEGARELRNGLGWVRKGAAGKGKQLCKGPGQERAWGFGDCHRPGVGRAEAMTQDPSEILWAPRASAEREVLEAGAEGLRETIWKAPPLPRGEWRHRGGTGEQDGRDEEVVRQEGTLSEAELATGHL
jgi:hypothetical protein